MYIAYLFPTLSVFNFGLCSPFFTYVFDPKNNLNEYNKIQLAKNSLVKIQKDRLITCFISK